MKREISIIDVANYIVSLTKAIESTDNNQAKDELKCSIESNIKVYHILLDAI